MTHVPTMTGGSDYDAVRYFYENYFVGRPPDDWSVKLISGTVGESQLVDEVMISFTHDCDMPAILPGVKPTGRKVVIPCVVVVGFDKKEKVAASASIGTRLACSPSSGCSIKKACPSPAPSRRPTCSIQPCRRTHLFLKIEVSSLRLLPPRCAFALRLRLNLPWRLLLRRSSPPLAEGAPEVKADADAPAERHPIEPPHSRRDGEIDEEQQEHDGEIGEEVHHRRACLRVDEDPLAPPRLAQEKRKSVRGMAMAQAMSTQGNHSVPGVSQRLSPAQIRTPATKAARWTRKIRMARSLNISPSSCVEDSGSSQRCCAQLISDVL